MNYKSVLNIFVSSGRDPLHTYRVIEIFCCIWHFVALSKPSCCCTVSFFIGIFFLRECSISLPTTITWSKNSSATFSPQRTIGFWKKRSSLDLTYISAPHEVCNCLFSVHEKLSFLLFAYPLWVLWVSKILSKSAWFSWTLP